MTHPEELLADYVDGSLGDGERAVVDAHLQGCATCRDEVELSRAAVITLRSLEEEPVPLGVTGPVLAGAGRRFERRSALWGRVQWVAGAAAAAALVLVVVVNLGRPGGDQDAADRAGGGAVPGETAAQDGGEESAVAAEAALPVLEVQRGVNYDTAGVRSLAEGAAERAEDDTLAAPGADAAPDRFAAVSSAIDCLRTSGAPLDEPTDTLVRLLQARFDGTPAYFAVFLESPGAGQPADTVVVWVAARDDCTRILDTASLRF